MRKLLSADFSRLWKEKALWIGSFCMLGLSLLVMVSGIRQSSRFPDDLDFSRLDAYYYSTAPYIGIVCSVILSLFIGKDYSGGTIRNKLIAGHRRTNIYLANLVVSVTVAGIVTLCWAVSGLIGIPYLGLWQKEPVWVAIYFLIIFLAAAAMAAILNLLAMTITNSTVAAIVQIVASLVLILTGSIIYNRLCESETTVTSYIISMDGVVPGEEIANPNYVSGTARTVLTTILNILPTGQMILADESNISMPVFNLAASVGVILGVTILGAWLFRKKDLK